MIYDIREGLREGYPLCCVMRYAWDEARGREPAVHAGRDRVCFCRGYVACGAPWHRQAPCLPCPTREYVEPWEDDER